VRKKRTGLKIALLVLAIFVVLCGIGGYLAARPILREYPSSLTAPDQVAGLSKIQDPDLQRVLDDTTRDFNASVKVDSTVAAFYSTGNDRQHMVMVFGGARLILSPGTDLTSALKGFSEGMGSPLTDLHPVAAGALGGVTRCGSGTLTPSNDVKVPIVLCAWADHGSVGFLTFYNRAMDDSVKLFGVFRQAILHRG
jgi:hypothetical protein